MIRIGIAGYGNLGRGVESALSHTEDMELVGVFTRRNPDSVKTKTGVPVYSMEQAKNMTDKIDVMILCGGSANDLPKQTAELAQYFNVIDSFDTHAKIPEHFADVDAACKKSGHLGMISVGWDPGMFSLNRLYGQAICRTAKTTRSGARVSVRATPMRFAAFPAYRMPASILSRWRARLKACAAARTRS